ncbi:hypothetical protein bplSymb_SCF21901P001 [Bathymodiolus platifrons methanotrophic gill symbiont]|uniref:LamG-like jellyroll fold domain-containing protein n=1 Tax=Bathymodiolus platifrons methanotrophic gill symbiont TaxID=113268 RepID=UPI000B4197BF|nr:LamG-like jellyroll fold domain-containing protein [Bathymodiolus platifrons methanotrophic gill symbiont]MCK5869666.1 LamG domain-containing protein [Methyloprofundus sp.]GAW87850.1 hypothetical protein bplSymb_SCF21901P001 [Bathymodiolus platifrons methanotrophic gill symbiont]
MKSLMTYLIFFFMFLGNTAKASLTDGLVAYYKFENDASDSSGNGNDGTEHGGITYTTGVQGQAVKFDGVDDYIYVNHDESLNVSGDFSISFWLYRATNNGIQDILVKGRDCLNHYMFNASGSNAGSRGQAFNVGNGSWWCDGVSASTSFPINEWHHVTGIIDNTNGVIKYYLDGELESENSISPYTTTNSYPLIMGRHFTSSDGRLGIYKYQFKGMLDEVRIYERALSEAEIQKLYNSNISVSPSIYDFGEVKVGDGRTVHVGITNTGGKTLTVNDLYFEYTILGDSFTADFPSLPFEIDANSLVEIPVNYSPSFFYEAERNNIIIESDDKDEPVVSVSFAGVGVSVTGDTPEVISSIQEYIDDAIEDETLFFIGRDHYKEFNNMLTAAASSSDPCVNLLTAYKRIDGHKKPQDWAEGPAKYGVSMAIKNIIDDELECGFSKNREESLSLLPLQSSSLPAMER